MDLCEKTNQDTAATYEKIGMDMLNENIRSSEVSAIVNII